MNQSGKGAAGRLARERVTRKSAGDDFPAPSGVMGLHPLMRWALFVSSSILEFLMKVLQSLRDEYGASPAGDVLARHRSLQGERRMPSFRSVTGGGQRRGRPPDEFPSEEESPTMA